MIARIAAASAPISVSARPPAIHYSPVGFHGADIILCKYPFRPDTKPMGAVDRIYVHNTFAHKTPRDILELHIKNGFSGIGYHFVIDVDGKTFYTRPIGIAGAHMYGHNSTSIGVAFINIDRCGASVAAYRSWRELHGALNRAHRRELPALTHTQGQFDYLNALLIDAESNADGKGRDTRKYDHSVIELGIFTACREDASIRIDGIGDTGKQRQLRQLERALKRCPETDVRTLVRILE